MAAVTLASLHIITVSIVLKGNITGTCSDLLKSSIRVVFSSTAVCFWQQNSEVFSSFKMWFFLDFFSAGIIKYMKNKAGPSSKHLESHQAALKFTDSKDNAIVGEYIVLV